MSWKKILGILCLLVIIAVAYTTLTATPKKTYNGTYMSFEYPADWNISTTQEATIEHVFVRKSNDLICVNAYKDASIEDVEANVTGLGPDEETIGEVHCIKYYNSELDMSFYIFQKDGRTFLVSCTVWEEWDAEHIIPSLKGKEYFSKNDTIRIAEDIIASLKVKK